MWCDKTHKSISHSRETTSPRLWLWLRLRLWLWFRLCLHLPLPLALPPCRWSSWKPLGATTKQRWLFCHCLSQFFVNSTLIPLIILLLLCQRWQCVGVLFPYPLCALSPLSHLPSPNHSLFISRSSEFWHAVVIHHRLSATLRLSDPLRWLQFSFMSVCFNPDLIV